MCVFLFLYIVQVIVVVIAVNDGSIESKRSFFLNLIPYFFMWSLLKYWVDECREFLEKVRKLDK